jgi:hypothetical protein
LKCIFPFIAPNAEVALPNLGTQVLEQSFQVNQILEVGQKEGMLITHVNHVLKIKPRFLIIVLTTQS